MSAQPNNVYGFIYKTILPDGRYYIGQHKIISKNTLDPTYFGSGVIIKDYIRAKGSKNLQRIILQFANSFDELNQLEKKFVTEEILADPLNINLDTGGKNKFTRYDEVKKRIGTTISKRRRENPEKWPSRVGVRNNKSKNWKLISPQGEKFYICGGLKNFCQEKGLSVNTLKKAVKEGWIPKRGVCSGWQIFDLDNNRGTVRDTLNRGEPHAGINNPWYKKKFMEIENE